MTETMEKYMSKTRGNYGSGVVRPKINDKTHFELKGQYLKELRENTFNGLEHEDANEHIEKVLKIVDLFHIPEVTQDQVILRVFPMSLTRAASLWLRNEPSGPGFYQRNNGNSSYPDQNETLEESLTKFMAESAKRHEENSNIIKEIQASIDAAIRNQGASINALEIQIGQMSKVLQERGIEADSSEIHCMGYSPYAVSGTQYRSIFFDTIPFPKRVQNFGYDDWREAQDVKILETYDHTLPQKEKDPGSFTLPCFIHNVCFDKVLVHIGASVSVILFSTYTNLGLGIISHTRLTIELADRTIKQPRGIAENVLVRIGTFIFLVDFIILDIPEDDDVPLILGRPFLSTAHSKIDVYKRKITLRVGEEKLVFKSIKPATSLIGRVFMLKDLD
ncbi:DNA/RNA polymerases superfamily protein [Tanacetum coccineum]